MLIFDKQIILCILELATINITFYSISRKITTQCQCEVLIQLDFYNV
jgi:hypothetical protein